jgi:hypothetical protein
VWDHLFGTFYLPVDDPETLVVTEPVPDGVIAGVLHPFRATSA